jgi:ubiquitin carboxyl-terminal hydrolase 14
VIGNLFEIELETELICAEVPDEPTTVQKEKVLRLSCHIDNNGNPINMLFEGLKISLEGDIEKRSPTLGRDAVYHKKSKINKLVSKYLSIISFLACLFMRPVCTLLLEIIFKQFWY